MTTTHDIDNDRRFTAELFRLLIPLREQRLPAPLSISWQGDMSTPTPMLRLQVQSEHFRSYFEQLSDHVLRTEPHEEQQHVHAWGKLDGRQLVHVVAVLDAGEELDA